MKHDVWDQKKGVTVAIDGDTRYIAFKRDEYGKKVLVEPAFFTGLTNKHYVFRSESGMDILINRNSDSEDVDCFYSNKNTWSISLNRFEDFEALI